MDGNLAALDQYQWEQDMLDKTWAYWEDEARDNVTYQLYVDDAPDMFHRMLDKGVHHYLSDADQEDFDDALVLKDRMVLGGLMLEALMGYIDWFVENTPAGRAMMEEEVQMLNSEEPDHYGS
jgi:hypothetical protein